MIGWILCLSMIASAQEQSKKTFDLGINVTSILSAFLGNQNTLEASDFPLSLRFGSSDFKFRFGIGLESSSKTIFDQVTLTTRQSEFVSGALRFGFDKYKGLSDRFSFYWGLDGLVSLSRNTVETQFNNPLAIEENAIGYGGGGVLGLRFNWSKRIYLSTEATIYGFARRETRSITNEVPFTNTFFDFTINPPLFLQFNIIFTK